MGPKVTCRSRLRGQREKLLRPGKVVAALRALLPARGVDLPRWNGAPNLSGIDAVGRSRCRQPAQLRLGIVGEVLKAPGSALIKAIQGSGFNELHAVPRQRFATVRMRKSEAARARCPEPYLLAKDFTIV
jgi:23S rRNA (uridine2552-2'-O)-methyltransferase